MGPGGLQRIAPEVGRPRPKDPGGVWGGMGGGSVLPRRCHTAAIWGRPLSAAERSGAAPGENKWSAVGFSFSSSKSFFSFFFS